MMSFNRLSTSAQNPDFMRSGAATGPASQGAATRLKRNKALTARGLVCRIGLVCFSLLLVACSVLRPPESWETYQNPQFQFEFVYPNSWTASPATSKGDGQAFTDPKNPAVEVSGWATLKSAAKGAAKSEPSLAQNFQTAQGWPGNLRVEIGRDMSVMTLTIQREQIAYGWQGKAPSQDFAAYYPTFAAIARQYKVPQSPPQTTP
jgi:hypothetical protein